MGFTTCVFDKFQTPEQGKIGNENSFFKVDPCKILERNRILIGQYELFRFLLISLSAYPLGRNKITKW